MEANEQLEKTEFNHKPRHWDERYAKNLDKLSKPVYGVRKLEDTVVYLRDGVKTYVDIYMPDTNKKIRFPGLVAFSAYGKSLQTIERVPLGMKALAFDHTIEAGDIEFYVKRGYVVAIPDPRGVGKSEGVWDGLYGSKEVEDCYDIIEWLAVQDYCDGNIGMVGISYFSIIQPLVAAANPPHLKAIMPIEVVDNLYHHNYPGGVFFDRSSIYNDFCPVRGYSATERTSTEEELKEMIEKRRKDPDVSQSALLQRVLSAWPPVHQSYFFDVVLHNNDDDFWQDRSLMNKIKDINIPMYLISEYYEYGRFTQGPFLAYNNSNDHVPKKVFAPEAHIDIKLPHRSMSEEYLRWYDHWLKGIDTGIMDEPPIKLYIREADRYRYEYEWPIARTKWTRFYLNKDSVLNSRPDRAGTAADTFTHLPPATHPLDCDKIPGLYYETPPLESDTEVTGNIALYLRAAISARDTNFSINVIDVKPDGQRLTITSGYVRAAHRPVENEYTRPWFPTNDHTRESYLEPGRIYDFGIEILPTSYVFKKGHRIRITIKNSEPNNFTSLTILPSNFEVRYDIYTGEDNPSYLLLPIIESSPEENWVK